MKALLPVATGNEEIEFCALVDVLRRADVDVTVGYTNWRPGFMFFREGREIFEWATFQGLVITQLDTNLVAAVIGMYFGGSLVKR